MLCSRRRRRSEILGEAVNRIFSPEFRNRLDAIETFQPLGTAEVERIVDKELAAFSRQLAKKGVRLSLDAGAGFLPSRREASPRTMAPETSPGPSRKV
jgi:ATP-dependent Clp protease ATP-binding subunit ClpA